MVIIFFWNLLEEQYFGQITVWVKAAGVSSVRVDVDVTLLNPI